MEGRGRKEFQIVGKGLACIQGVDWAVWIVLLKKEVELKNVKTRAFLTVCEVLQLLTNVSW